MFHNSLIAAFLSLCRVVILLDGFSSSYVLYIKNVDSDLASINNWPLTIIYSLSVSSNQFNYI